MSDVLGLQWPPSLSDDQLERLFNDSKDWQILHGSVLKLVNSYDDNSVLATTVGTTYFPSIFPQQLFNEALQLQEAYNKLYMAVSEDEEWLFENLQTLIEADDFTKTLWNIHQEANKDGYPQEFTLGIFRSDYMIHDVSSQASSAEQKYQLKQVEFNTIACAGGVHSNKVSDMHRHFQQSGKYLPHEQSKSTLLMAPPSMPPNHTLKTLTDGLALAHETYGSPRNAQATATCILFIVQPDNFNVADERPLEYALWERSIQTYRAVFAEEILAETSLGPSGELLYRSPTRAASIGLLEVSVVYFRAGFAVEEYTPIGYQARLQLEKSRAIKCPSLLSHLTTFKKVQQALAVPGKLSRFLGPEEAAKILRTFHSMYPMDESDSGLIARRLATSLETAGNFILKPSLEGGGHNIYGEAIPHFLAETTPATWHKYVLMEKIRPPVVHNILMSAQGVYEGPVISELGVFGTCLWKRCKDKKAIPDIMEQLKPCWSFKTKGAGVDEMSVVKGYGCFDSPLLVESDIFRSLCHFNSRASGKE
ncbi:glutathione synthetase [Tricladium varicosporioides]|nr:glutathione synthetase [Hymenoscyphus varicosporioides]